MRNSAKSAIVSILMLFVVQTISPLVCAKVDEPDWFEEGDRDEEHRKTIQRLTGDKKKIELAIATTKRLLEQSLDRPYLPELYLRLAELYIEESRLVFTLRLAETGGNFQSLDSLEGKSLKKKAIEVYQRIINHYPNFSSIDKVHFFLAHEYRELGRIADMVKEYLLITEKFGDSQYVPESYLLLGDFYAEKQLLEKARENYQAVLRYPGSSAISIARYKLAWVHINNRNYGDAMKYLEESVLGNSSDKGLDVDTYNRVDIRLESLMDMAYLYSMHYKDSKPGEGAKYLKQFAWSRPVYIAVLEKLGFRYLLKKKWENSAYIYRKLSTLQHSGPKLLEYAENIYTCVRKLGDYSSADKDVALIVKALRLQKYSIHVEDEEKEKSISSYELYARDVSTRLHERARVSKSLEDFSKAADAYKIYLEFFKETKQFAEMESNYAESLFSAYRYTEAGKVYERMAGNKLNSDKVKRANLYSATLSYYSALKNRETLNYYQVSQARSGLKATGTLYAKNYPDSKQVADVLFNVAWIQYDEGKYKEAIEGFVSFTDRYPRGKEAKAAVGLIIDAYHVMEDYEGLVQYGSLVANSSKLSRDIKREVSRTSKAAESKVITNLVVASVNDWESGRQELSSFADEHASSALGEQALNALFVSSKEKGDIESMLVTGRKLVTKYPQSKDSENISRMLIDTSLRAYQFRILAVSLEDYVRYFPKKKDSFDFLHQAAQIRQNLRQYAQANKDYRVLLKNHTIRSRTKKKIIHAIADNEQKLGDYQSAIQTLESNRRYFKGKDLVEVDARIANLYHKRRNYSKENVYRKRVFVSYKPKKSENQRLNSEVAQMTYNNVHSSQQKYMETQLVSAIEDVVVARKKEQYGKLQQGYFSVLQNESPRWSLLACYRLHEINSEFARFLLNAPVPEMSEEELAQYKKLISEQAQDYLDEAQQYLQSGKQLSKKLELMDVEFADYISDFDKSYSALGYFGSEKEFNEISMQALTEEKIRDLHYQLVKKPDDVNTIVRLAMLYKERKDYLHAIVIVNNMMENIKGIDAKIKVIANKLIGISYIAVGEDLLAREAFDQARKISPKDTGTTINLAAMYHHYGYVDKAKSLYEKIKGRAPVLGSENLIHHRALALYDLNNR